MPICNQCSVFEENEDVEGWRAGRNINVDLDIVKVSLNRFSSR